MSLEKLKSLRSQIDQVDQALLELLNQRLTISVEIGAAKLVSGRQVFAPDRDEEVLRALEKKNPGPMESRALRAIYREIIKSSIAAQSQLAIGFLGSLRRGCRGGTVVSADFGKLGACPVRG